MPDSAPPPNGGPDGAPPSMAELFPGRPGGAPTPVPDGALRGETILMTGAGGSLGTALTRQLVEGPARRLVLLDSSEHGLIQLKQQVEAMTPRPQPAVEYVLADLRLPADRQRALETAPTAVIHAAAYKHVPFLEDRPIPATQNNLLATADWLAACRQRPGVDRFVLVSTDKAARPTGVMGATKAAAERLVRGVRAAPTPGLVATTARLCNIFGSRGSVVPLFWRRLQEGQPLPVTHPDMERWFVSPQEAAQCVLHVLGRDAGTYLPAACRSVSILDLARRLVRWHRPTADPEAWIQIAGLRKGERIRERLLDAAERRATPARGPLQRVHRDTAPDLDGLRRDLDRLETLCEDGADDALRAALSTAVRASGEIARADTEDGTVYS